MKCIIYVFCICCILFTNNAISSNSYPPSYEEALNLIHTYGGAGNEIQEALVIINDLSKSHPTSGYAETLFAEILSTWKLNLSGKPVSVRDQVIELTKTALRMNPGLVQAHVAKSRALLRSSMYDQAIAEIDMALVKGPENIGAIFIRAELYREVNDMVNADIWYKKFINMAPNKSRKSNAYFWLAKGYEDAALNNYVSRESYIQNAREAYRKMIELDPNHALKNVNFAIFLNGYVADFDEAEKYALKALSIMEFKMARFHLAAARFQKLWKKAPNIDSGTIKNYIREIELSTNVSLLGAIEFSSFSSVVRSRLIELAKNI